MTIGVAIALYNGEKFIREQLDSIREQTVSPDMVVMCDDGSKDKTVEAVEGYIEEFSLSETWKIIKNDKNLGYARNFYKAMSLCNTDLIFLCDQDDVWCNDKIEKMRSVMEQRSDILVLASKFGMIDGEGNEMHGVLERRAKETGELREINHLDLLKAYYWPGMIMCVRKSFFDDICELVNSHAVAHDRVLAHFAAEKKGFFEYDYIGAYHRRHGNNTANEEHRIFKLLNRQRKLRDMRDHSEMLKGLLEIELPFSKESVAFIQESLNLSLAREQAVADRDKKKLKEVYKNKEMTRKISYICDLWLIYLGK